MEPILVAVDVLEEVARILVFLRLMLDVIHGQVQVLKAT